jgi:hypothetical protein
MNCSELEKHDKEETGWRDEKAMADEAQDLRNYWKQIYS